MKNIFLIDGAAGVGKTDLISFLLKEYKGKNNSVGIVSKYTTRPIRKEEKNKQALLDLKFVNEDEFNNIRAEEDFYEYEYEEFSYGFHKRDLDETLKKHNNVFIIVRNRDTIDQIKEDYSLCDVISVFIYTDEAKIIERLKAENKSDEEINFRLSRSKKASQDYYQHNHIYDEVLINNSNRTDYNRLIEVLIDWYRHDSTDQLAFDSEHIYDIPPHLKEHRKEMLKRLKKYPFEKNVFIMMKFRKENEDIYDLIKDTLAIHGLNAVRSDDKEWQLCDDVSNPLAVLFCCKYGIALFDKPEKANEFNPNVIYELGFMHSQAKRCLLLKDKAIKNMPFDIVKHIYKEYSDSIQIKKLVTKWIAEKKIVNKE